MSPLLLTGVTMLAFAANSILCRMALGEGSIDAAAFTLIRLISGSVMLAIILYSRNRSITPARLDYISSLMLFAYAICFSFSYINLSAGSGALILFGAVQLTMILYGLFRGERPGRLAWAGIVAAFAGLVYLLLPSVTAPPLDSAILMLTAGIAWGVYSLRGKAAKQPLTVTAWNFIGAVPLAVLAAVIFYPGISMTTTGILLAMASGALASGLGYAIWYSVLPRLTPTNAATVQLSVPVIAAFGGVVLLAEPVSIRLLIASVVVLGGIYMTIRPARNNS